ATRIGSNGLRRRDIAPAGSERIDVSAACTFGPAYERHRRVEPHPDGRVARRSADTLRRRTPPALHRATQEETNMQTSIMRSASPVAPPMALAGGAGGASLAPAVACGFAKMHAALKASAALNACFRHAIQTGSDPDPACVDAAHATLRTTFAKI